VMYAYTLTTRFVFVVLTSRGSAMGQIDASTWLRPDNILLPKLILLRYNGSLLRLIPAQRHRPQPIHPPLIPNHDHLPNSHLIHPESLLLKIPPTFLPRLVHIDTHQDEYRYRSWREEEGEWHVRVAESSMMADETKGPTKEEVLPMMEKRAKKRNWRVSGELEISGEEEGTHLLAARDDFGDHRLRNSIPRANKDPIEGLVCPEFSDVVEAEFGLGDTDASPGAEDEDPECFEEEHGLGPDGIAFLDEPEDTDSAWSQLEWKQRGTAYPSAWAAVPSMSRLQRSSDIRLQ